MKFRITALALVSTFAYADPPNFNQDATAVMNATRIGIIRSNAFNLDSNGDTVGPYPADLADRVVTFAPPDGVSASDIAVVGDWNGDGRSKAGWFRPTGGQWFLDANNNGVWDPGVDYQYSGFGGPGDVPVVGDWAGLGKTSIGIRTGGFLWVLDTAGDGKFVQPTPTCTPLAPPAVTPTYPNCGNGTVTLVGSAVFAFGTAGDVPVVGNWFAKKSASNNYISQAGVVRPSTTAGCTNPPTTKECTPFLWLLDSGVAGTFNQVTPSASQGDWNANTSYNANDIVQYNGSFYISQIGNNLNRPPVYGQPWLLIAQAAGSTHMLGNAPGTGFGGIAGDIPVTGDWYNTGFTYFGVFRASAPGTPNFFWVLDNAVPLSAQNQHVIGLAFGYGGLAGDKPITGKW